MLSSVLYPPEMMSVEATRRYLLLRSLEVQAAVSCLVSGSGNKAHVFCENSNSS